MVELVVGEKSPLINSERSLITEEKNSDRVHNLQPRSSGDRQGDALLAQGVNAPLSPETLGQPRLLRA